MYQMNGDTGTQQSAHSLKPAKKKQFWGWRWQAVNVAAASVGAAIITSFFGLGVTLELTALSREHSLDNSIDH